MHFDLTDLSLFVNVAEASNMTHGAKKSCISTGAASMRIKGLESQLGTLLLYRERRGVELTDSGIRLLQHARLILRQVGYLKTEFAEFGTDLKGHIRIFANTTAVTEFLPEVLAGFLANRPGVTIDLRERLTRDIISEVQIGAADLGVVAGPIVANDLQILPFSVDRLVLVVGKDHPLKCVDSVKLVETLPYKHICLHQGSTLHEFMQEQARQVGEKLTWRIQLSSFESICRMVEAGVGVGVVPESAAVRHRKMMDITIVQLDESWARRERSILVREINALPGCSRALIDLLRPDENSCVSDSM
ncbi:transcriptional regulator, LysR family [Pseudomonas syringae]|uniref:HTH lysR-type domain-containing protein n=1 Tax=Pseudomonas syringae pv. apii TaxID=81036 RepID=A0A3M3S214_9PSED|nr:MULTISPECIES: LysR substrate-binding domain-containing protein [Pseudomonas syringae group]RMN40291.1 hypothetical protein ALQ59_200038 [Pseudomonas syringae pv. apii]RMN56188.1 hypothetical protein ALQ58_200138 [Pseudomonas syringae pv. apii]RMO02753.1 hypothetical protein ALQ49_02408 [Pseudomonas syringae pv. apii]SDZ38766.1 transcriptional regulator, LysR family [Pseudomonas syringae]